MAEVKCYLCLAGATGGASINVFTSQADEPMGSCHRCGVFACGHHALRNTNPVGLECVACVPSYIAPPPGRGGGPTPPRGGGPGGATPPPPAAIQESYSEEQFVADYPAVTDALRQKVADAIRNPDVIMEEYFGESYLQRIAEIFEVQGEANAAQKTRIAAALAVIIFTNLPDHLLSHHLRRHPEAATLMTV